MRHRLGGLAAAMALLGAALTLKAEPCPPVVQVQLDVFESDVVVDESRASVASVEMHAPASRCSARVAMPKASDPEPGSLSAYAPMVSLVRRGRYFALSASLP